MSKIIAYHGSKDSFNQAGVDHSHGKTSNIGLYLSDSKDIARTYAGRTGYVYEIELSLNNPMVVDFEGVNWDSFDYDGTATSYFILDSEGNELGWYSNLPDAEFAESDFDEPVKIVKDVDPEKTWSTDDIARNAKREGHDSVVIENVIDSADKSVREPSTVYVVFDNACIVNTRLVSESLSESFIGFVKSLDRGWNKSLIEAIVEGYAVIFESNAITITGEHLMESDNNNDDLQSLFDELSEFVDSNPNVKPTESPEPEKAPIKDGGTVVAYHGSNAVFNEFSKEKIGTNFSNTKDGFFFSDDLEYVDYLAKKLSKEKGGTPTLYKCQLDLGRTYTARNYFDTFSESEADKMYAATQGDVIDIFDSYRDDIISKARSNKCNSIHFHSAGVHLYVVFESNQIKILSRSSLTESLTESISDYSDIINGHTIPELVHYDWNKIAFGFSNDDVINIPLSKLKIKWKQDMENVIGFDMKEYFDNIPYDSLPPIEASFDGKNFYVEDGHHRYGYAKQLKLKNVPVVVEITANPFKKLGFDIDDVVEYKTGKRQ